MQETFVGRLRGACAVLPDSHVLVAVSGGADSTALLCFSAKFGETYPISVSCAHVEHGIRGAASEEDMRFVKALCEQKNVPFYGGRVDAPGYARGRTGAALRKRPERCAMIFLKKTAEAVGADAIALAHHRGIRRRPCCFTRRGKRYPRALRDALAAGKLIRPLLDAEPERAARVSAAHRSAVARGRRNQRLRGLREKPDSPFGAACAGGGAYPDAQGRFARLAASAQRDEDYCQAATSWGSACR